jgi:hypothetical protein
VRANQQASAVCEAETFAKVSRFFAARLQPQKLSNIEIMNRR